MTNKKLIVVAAVVAVLALGVGTAFAAQQSALAGQKDVTATTSTVSATQENENAQGLESEGSENEAGENKDSEESLSGSPAQQAADAALKAIGGGKVLEVEKADNFNAAYEVEVRKTDGNIAEVLLDGNFKVIDQTAGD